MKRILTFLTIMLVAFALVIPVPAQAVSQYFRAEVYSWDGTQSFDGKPKLTLLTSGVRYWVTAINTSTLETLYESDGTTSLTNPVTSTNYASDTVGEDKISFWVDPTDSSADRYVDLYVVGTDGFFTLIENFDKYQHTVILDKSPGKTHHGIYRTAVISGTTEVDTEVDFPYDSLVINFVAEVITVDTGASNDINVGLDTSAAGDIDGFIANADLTTAGYVTQSATNMGDLIDDGTSQAIVYGIAGTVEQTMSYAGDSAANSTGVANIHYWFNYSPLH